jgi:hypothetical protein
MPPHAWQRPPLPLFTHSSPAPQYRPLLPLSQQIWSCAPHATQLPFCSKVYGAVHPIPPGHAGSPSRPQRPDWQPPLVQVPALAPAPQAVPAPRHRPVLLSQHPPPPQLVPLQHG